MKKEPAERSAGLHCVQMHGRRLRTRAPRGQQRQQIGGVGVAVIIDITIARSPGGEQIQQVGGVDIPIAIKIGRALLEEAIAELGRENWEGPDGLWAKIRDYIRHERAVDKMVDKGEVPADYNVVKVEQEMLNKVDEKRSFKERISEDTEIRHGAIERVRLKVAHIREAGFVVGQRHQAEEVPFEEGVKGTPFKQGSGEAKQWVRGYCMGRNVIDIKPYYDAA